MPESVAIGIFSKLGNRLDVMAGATWTRWSRVQSVAVVRTSPSGAGPAGSTIDTLAFNWRDTTFLAAGASYQAAPDWKLRVGVAYDPATAPDTTRTPRLPDETRLLITLGARYAPWKQGSLDLAYGP